MKRIIKNIRGRRPTRLFTMIMRNFIFFTVFLAIMFVVFLVLAVYDIQNSKNIPYDELANQFSSSKDYEKIDTSSYIFEKDYLQIYDVNGKIIYSTSKKGYRNKLSSLDLELIPEYGSYYYYTDNKVVDFNGDSSYVVTTSIIADDLTESLESLVLLDKDYNIKYSTKEYGISKLTKRQYNLLRGVYNKSFYITKVPFYNQKEERNVMVIYSENLSVAPKSKVAWAIVSIIIRVLIVYLIILTFFSFLIYRRVIVPLKSLDASIEQVKLGNLPHKNYPRGPREIMDIGANFNKMSQELYMQRREMEELRLEKNKLIADISHDLKTPITIISGYAKAIVDGLVPEDQLQKYLSIIQERAQGLNNLINEFNDFSLLDHPDHKLQLRPVDICEFTRSYMAARFDEITLEGFEVKLNIPERPIMVNLDETMFRKVYNNIISNMYKYAQSASMFYLQVKEENNKCKIYIGDDGPGVSQTLAKDIFKVFAIGDNSRSKGSSGLGLSIVERIVENHQGTIGLTEEHKELNLEFCIELPLIN